jgi:heme/copper-type cytochrome/quinol oxidase subunit 1
MTNLMVGGAMALMIRAVLVEPGLQIMQPDLYQHI